MKIDIDEHQRKRLREEIKATDESHKVVITLFKDNNSDNLSLMITETDGDDFCYLYPNQLKRLIKMIDVSKEIL